MSERVRELLERNAGAGAVETFEARDGVPELPLAAPESEEELAEVVRLAAAERWSVLPIGSGSKLSWTAPPARADLVLSTRRLAGVVAYEPGDGTVAARAGTTMAALRAEVGRGGHHLTPDVPAPHRATLGGVVAAGESGLDRLRYGPVRNHVLGARVLLASGRIARSGGRLVKNVTGYDVHRLLAGSHGTLGVIVEVALRLFPAPEARAAVEASLAGRDEALAAARAVRALSARPVAIVLRREDAGAPWTIEVHLAGRPEVVQDEERRVAASVAREVRVERGDAALAAAARARDAVLGPNGRWPRVRMTCTPSRLPAALAAAEEACAALGIAARVIAHPGVAEAWLRADALDPERARLLHGRLASAPARVRWTDAPAELRRELDEPPSPALGLMRRIERALDPDSLLAAGRSHGGL